MTAMLTTTADPATHPWMSQLATIGEANAEVAGIVTYRVDISDPVAAQTYRFLPGQFNMLYLPGIGEAAISISSDAGQPTRLLHTVRAAGSVTSALARKGVGDQILIRGPYGSAWPMDKIKGLDVVLACGGVGLAPLRPAIYHIMRHRGDYGRVFLLYGARTPGDMLYESEYAAWRDKDITVETTVDIGDGQWRGNIGVVPVLFYRMRLNAAKTCVLTCGPEIMIRFVVFESLARKISPDRIILSMERNMNCAIGHCGHCQIGPMFVCKDGPVFTYRQIEPFMHVEDF